MASPAEIRAFWFADDLETAREEWFRGGDAFDAACLPFQSAWEAAHAGKLDDWLDQPSSLVAFVILTDQFPRNLFRADDRAYATDAIALAAAQKAIAAGWDSQMATMERVFLYLPFEHAEDVGLQRESVRLYTELGVEQYVPFAQAHLDIVERFGRFPHRNALLGRETTPDEAAFLRENGRGF
ncbi:MAG: DUF924 family protein [Alphaproteobacteria bacterium]|jgi:uncharacterized protein (DUF924 family)